MERVSIFLSTYNGAGYLDHAIQSVLLQSYPHFVFRILDDGSTDQTWQILEKYAALDSRVQISRNLKNRGTGYCYSKMLRSTKGEFVAAIGQDDYWSPSYLEQMVQKLEQSPDCSAAFSRVAIMDGSGGLRTDISSPFRESILGQLIQSTLVLELLEGNFLCAAAACFRRGMLADWASLGYNDQLQDWGTWLHLASKGPFALVDQVLVHYRIHGNNLSLGNRSPVLVEIDLRQTRLQFLEAEVFWRFILTQADADKLFNQVMSRLFEGVREGTSEDWFVYLYALRRNAELLEKLPSYPKWLGRLFWQQGAISKSKQLLGSDFDGGPEPARGWSQSLSWRYLLFIARPSIRVDLSHWQKTKKIGCLVLTRVLLPAKVYASGQPAPFLRVVIDFRAKSTDRLIEGALISETRSVFSWGRRVWNLVKEKKWKILPALKEKLFQS